MVDVTSDNFEQLLPEVLADIKSALFVAIDTEFTGLLADDEFKNSLFDGGRGRYLKQRDNISRFNICQLGLAVFKSIPSSNGYTVTSYNFYLRPESCASYDPFFTCQTSSLEFLRKYNFDFNKWLNHGVSFMNLDDSEKLKSELEAVVRGEKFIELPIELHDQLRVVEKWAETAEDGDTTTITETLNNASQFKLVTTLRDLNLDLWLGVENGQIVVQKVSKSRRKELEEKDLEGLNLVSTVVERLTGFTRVFRYLVELQKPLVLHNSLLDLMLLYKQFHRSLPESYNVFKSDMHKLFPMIFDTKFLSRELEFICKKDERASSQKVRNMVKATSLGRLSTSLREELPVLYRPTLTLLPHGCKYNDTNKTSLHEAGYDAYLTGFCFITLSHTHSMLKMPSATQHRPLSPRELLYSMKAYANRVPMARSRVLYLNLEGNDLSIRQPPWLLVEARQRRSRLTPALVSSLLARYGQFDIQPRNKTSALVASASWKCTRDVYANMAKNDVLKVQIYNKWKHKPMFRNLGLSVGLVSSGLSVWLVYKTFKTYMKL